MGENKEPKKEEAISQEELQTVIVSPELYVPSEGLESDYSSLSLILGESRSWSEEPNKVRIDTKSDLPASLLSQENVEELFPEGGAASQSEVEAFEFVELPRDESKKLTGLDRLRSIQPPSHYDLQTVSDAELVEAQRQIPTPQSIDNYDLSMESLEIAPPQKIGLPGTPMPKSSSHFEQVSVSSELYSTDSNDSAEKKRGWKSWGGIVKQYQDSAQRLRARSSSQLQVSSKDDK